MILDHTSGGQNVDDADWFRTVQRGHVGLAAKMMSGMGCEHIREENRRWKFE